MTSIQNVKNEALRLTFAEQEGDYIARKLVETQKRFRRQCFILSMASLVFIGIFLFAWINNSSLPIAVTLLLVVAIATAIIYLVRVPFTWLEINKYRLYDIDHGAFLRQYNRDKP